MSQWGNYYWGQQPPLFADRQEGGRWIYYIWDIDEQDWMFVWGEG